MSDSISQKGDIGQGRIQPGRYLWIVLALITSAAVTQALMRQGLPVFYPFIQDEFGLSRAQVGLITSFNGAGSAIMAILAGWLADTFGVKRMITIAMLMLTATILLLPLAYSFPLLLSLSLLLGIVVSPIPPAMTRAILDWFPVRIRALAMSIKQTGIPIAGAITAAMLPALAVVIGWRMAAAVPGLLVLVIAIAFIWLYRDAPQGIQTVHKFNLAALKTILLNRGLVTTIIWGATFVGFQFIALSYLMLFLIEELELSPIMAGGLLAIAHVSSIIARVTWGAVSDFVLRGRRIVVLTLAGFLTILWMLGASFMGVGVPSITVYLIAIVVGISTMSFHGVYVTFIGEQAGPGQVGLTIGVSNMAVYVSQVVMPPLFGYLVDISSSYSLSWRATAAVALVCTLALLAFGRETQHR
ncbi:MFS transporter [Chloroflexota bacterium]